MDVSADGQRDGRRCENELNEAADAVEVAAEFAHGAACISGRTARMRDGRREF